MKPGYILPFLLFNCGLVCAQQEATTTDGRKVILYSNGTWKPAWKGSASDLHPVPASHPELPAANAHEKTITHTGYTLSYNTTYHIANWVAYQLTAEETVPVVKRNNHFVPDPQLTCCNISNADYKDSGYDRGHLAPAGDMCYSFQTMVESFYLSNMAPQVPGFNRGIWKKLEEQVRQWAIDNKVVYVVTGPVLSKGLPAIGPDGITVPSRFYKVILDYTEPDIKGIGFIMSNEESREPIRNFTVTIDSVEKLTGIDFFYQLPDQQEKVIESTLDLSKWSWTTTVPTGKLR